MPVRFISRTTSLPVRDEARILGLVAAAAQFVLVVVGELDGPHAQLGEELDEADAPLEQVGVLEAEDDRGAARRRR